MVALMLRASISGILGRFLRIKFDTADVIGHCYPSFRWGLSTMPSSLGAGDFFLLFSDSLSCNFQRFFPKMRQEALSLFGG